MIVSPITFPEGMSMWIHREWSFEHFEDVVQNSGSLHSGPHLLLPWMSRGLRGWEDGLWMLIVDEESMSQ